jgi:photosystem II stability/assembly factor-like uncharacterized protein
VYNLGLGAGVRDLVGAPKPKPTILVAGKATGTLRKLKVQVNLMPMRFSDVSPVRQVTIIQGWWTTCLFVLATTSLVAAESVPVVTSDVVTYARQPQVAVDEMGVIYLAFGAGEAIYVCKSQDNGETYGLPVKVATLPKLALGMRRGPRVSATKHAIVVTAISHDSGDLVAWNSTDSGQTWSAPVVVNDSPKVAREGLHAMALGKDGLLFCAWLDLRNDGTQIYGASSADGGRTWSENCCVYASPSGTVCECCHPSVAIDGAGTIYVMWRNVLEGDRDMFLAVSQDVGRTFGEAQKLGLDSWKLDACPMDGGCLAVSAQGQLSTVWRHENKIFRVDQRRQSKRMTQDLLGKGEQPWATATSAGVVVVWLSRRGGKLWLSKPTSSEAEILADDASDPVIAAPLTGGGPIVVAWETGTKPNTSIRAAIVTGEVQPK